jgi:hypothetical protein
VSVIGAVSRSDDHESLPRCRRAGVSVALRWLRHGASRSAEVALADHRVTVVRPCRAGRQSTGCCCRKSLPRRSRRLCARSCSQAS